MPSALRNVATTAWGHAALTFTGLDHLEGKQVSVLGDGLVVAAPQNAAYGAPLTLADGSLTLPAPSVVVHVGLPYASDLETLDIDTASGPSLKPFSVMVNQVRAIVESSKPFFAGPAAPTGDGRALPFARAREPKPGRAPGMTSIPGRKIPKKTFRFGSEVRAEPEQGSAPLIQSSPAAAPD